MNPQCLLYWQFFPSVSSNIETTGNDDSWCWCIHSTACNPGLYLRGEGGLYSNLHKVRRLQSWSIVFISFICEKLLSTEAVETGIVKPIEANWETLP